MDVKLKEKLEKVVGLTENNLANPDINLSYCIPEVKTDAQSCDISGEPYIELTYAPDEAHVSKLKIPLKGYYLEKSAEDIANLVTFHIEQFISEIDTVDYGAQ